LNLKELSLTIIIPTCNAGQRFAELLDSLQKQYPGAEQIIVADSESTDNTAELAKSRNCRVITIDRPGFDHGTARNLIMSEVTSEFAIFLTQDVIPVDKNMIAELIRPMQTDPNIAICYGRQLPGLDTRPLERFARNFNYPEGSMLKTRNDIKTLGLKTFFCSNSCSAIRCSVFKKLGGFKNDVIVNEDMLFAAQAILQGYSVYYSAAAKVYHIHSYSLLKILSRYFNIGRFFADNRWILKHTSLNSYSGNMLKAGIKTFWKQKMLHYIPALLFEFTIKAAACKIGWYYQLTKSMLFGSRLCL
jgi:rhamnosyltransferase